MELLSLHNVCKRFQDHNSIVHAVSDVSLELQTGEMIAIIGPSGSGKTTLLNIAGLVIPPDSGEIILDGQKVCGGDAKLCALRNQYYGYIVQDYALVEEDTALQNILIPTLYTKQKKPSSEYQKIISEYAEKLQVTDKLKCKVKKLSGGERQRIAVIRSLICGQKIILADEPTGSLDQENAEMVMACLQELTDTGEKSVILVTHDLNIAKQCDRVFRLDHGTISVFS